MDNKAPCIILWCIIYCLISAWGSVQYHHATDIKSNTHGEDVLKSLLGTLDLNSTVPEQDKFPSPPQYMLDLYQAYSSPVRENILRYKTANIVRSFYNKDESTDRRHYHFDLNDSIPKYEEIIGAEFRFFIHRTVYELQQFDAFEVQLYEGQHKLVSRFLEERMNSDNYSDWEVFDVKSFVKKWFDNPSLNEGFTVKVLDSAGHLLLNQRMQKDTQSVLIIFSRNPKITKSASTFLSTQDPTASDSIPNIGKVNEGKGYSSTQKITRKKRSASASKKDLCKRHNFRIDFSEIGWHPWIIEPKWYNAYACKGACVFGKNQNTTTHARMQSLVHHLGLSNGMGTPCCVPTELQPLSILFYDKNSNSVLAKFDDMVATDCGCR